MASFYDVLHLDVTINRIFGQTLSCKIRTSVVELFDELLERVGLSDSFAKTRKNIESI